MGDLLARHPAHDWSPGRRVHYKMIRLTDYKESWDAAQASVRGAFETAAATHSELVPSVAEIIERDIEMRTRTRRPE